MELERTVDIDFEDDERKVPDVCETEEPVILRKGGEHPKYHVESETIFPYARKIFNRSRGTRGRSSLGIF